MPAYRLQTVLEMRERKEQEAQEAFAQALREVKAAQDEQARMESELVERKQERARKVQEYLQKALNSGSAANAMQSMNRYEARLRDEEAELAGRIELQKEEVERLEREAEGKRLELLEATKEKKAVEKHKEKWAKQVKAERATREETNQDEIGQALHLARKKDAIRRGS